MTGHLKAMFSRTGSSVRDRLLEAGVAVFSRSGFNGSSVQDVTEAAGVPKGSFYNHFDSKEALGVAVIEHVWAEQGRRSLAVLGDEALEPLARLRTYFEIVAMDAASAGYTCGCIIGNMTAELSDHSAMVSDRLSAVFTRWTRQIAACIKLAQEAGGVTSRADPEVLATFALNAWQGALLRARVTKSSKPLQQFTETLFTQLLG